MCKYECFFFQINEGVGIKFYCSLGQSRDADILFINESNAKSNIESWDFFSIREFLSIL